MASFAGSLIRQAKRRDGRDLAPFALYYSNTHQMKRAYESTTLISRVNLDKVSKTALVSQLLALGSGVKGMA